ncbi:MAG TPA: transporter, partial [bacterium]|nr:transporter [bacterium]
MTSVCARVLLHSLVTLFAWMASADLLHAGRPLTTETADVIPAGKGQVEMSWDYAAAFDESRNHILLAVPGVGIANRAEFTLELPFVLGQQKGRGLEPGLGDIRPMLKVLLYPGKGAIPAFALQGFFKFDTGEDDEGLGTGSREAGFFGIVSKQIEAFMIHGMLGLDF